MRSLRQWPERIGLNCEVLTSVQVQQRNAQAAQRRRYARSGTDLPAQQMGTLRLATSEIGARIQHYHLAGVARKTQRLALTHV